jgi:hypothetical protein
MSSFSASFEIGALCILSPDLHPCGALAKHGGGGPLFAVEGADTPAMLGIKHSVACFLGAIESAKG